MYLFLWIFNLEFLHTRRNLITLLVKAGLLYRMKCYFCTLIPYILSDLSNYKGEKIKKHSRLILCDSYLFLGHSCQYILDCYSTKNNRQNLRLMGIFVRKFKWTRAIFPLYDIWGSCQSNRVDKLTSCYHTYCCFCLFFC